ncbi:hypothetical protein MFIFM68171_06690 [Madurella fahalii]|uniref:Peptidase S33 tripeptidyl aminopeptidase-like C-terminal domain-containing protein n=1 Tax=Madurella fahalii TaxID=1157608 RepID=A0ABQ0GFL0_9PEZI
MDVKHPGGPAWAVTQPSERRHDSRPRRHLGLGLAAILIAVVFLGWLPNIRLFSIGSHRGHHGTNDTSDDPMNPWESITPSEDLEWHSCYGIINPRFRCARLTVPMDYNRPLGQSSSNPKVHIALVLLPAQDSTEAQTSPKSPMLINPGGPGGSGTLTALLLGPAVQRILGSDQPVIGFDPRGIAFTTPRADCWAKPPACDGCPEDVASGFMHRMEWDNMNSVFGSVNSSNVALKFLNAGQRAVNELCRSKNAQLGSQSILGHASTAHVARDMVSIVDAWDRWSESEGLPPSSLKGKLVYWGFSYGTFLGATFAKMFPDRAGRMILDGVVDAEYYVSPFWKESLLDTDNVLKQLFEYCAEAGKKCDLYREGDTAADIHRRYDGIMDQLESTPVTFTHPENFFPVILRSDLIKLIVFSMLYSPNQGFPVAATLLDWIHQGKVEQLGALFRDASLMCKLPGNSAVASLSSDAQRAIMCGDKTQPVNLTLAEIASAYEDMASISQFAGIWMNLMMACNGWDIYGPHPTPKHPWSAALSSNPSSQDQVETAFPLLFLSSTYDPVTPLAAAVKMALQFKDAGLVEQLSEGHCTIAAASTCTAKVVRDYVHRGKVPAPPVAGNREWMRCGVDEGPWGIIKHRNEGVLGVGAEEEREIMQGWKEVQKALWVNWGILKGSTGMAIDKLVYHMRESL